MHRRHGWRALCAGLVGSLLFVLLGAAACIRLHAEGGSHCVNNGHATEYDYAIGNDADKSTKSDKAEAAKENAANTGTVTIKITGQKDRTVTLAPGQTAPATFTVAGQPYNDVRDLSVNKASWVNLDVIGSDGKSIEHRHYENTCWKDIMEQQHKELPKK